MVQEVTPGSKRRGRREQILELLRHSTSPKEVCEIATALRVHPNTVRFHLNGLVARGQVEKVETASVRPGRPALGFRARQGMDPSGPRTYLPLAEMLMGHLADQPDPCAAALEAGSNWGRRVAATRTGGKGASEKGELYALVELLDELGFAPQRPARRRDGWEISLRHCPFLDLAGHYAPLVCRLHLGLMRAALNATESGLVIEALDAFVEPDRCSVLIAPGQGPPQSDSPRQSTRGALR